MLISHKSVYTFGEFRLDAGRRRLWRGDEAVAVSSKVLDLLLAFVREQGRVFSKEELMQQIWPDAIVEESNLAVSVSTLRRALGEKSGEKRFIATVPGRGYQFVAQVQAEETNEDVLVIEKQLAAEI